MTTSPHTQANVQECFVVMPFGQKPLPDGRTYDFDKVYRVVIQRAIKDVGMRPLRADETVGSRLIHSDMFRDLRDRPVVLADLSLENANVFYELGVRHVMSPNGTVLICREGTTLPFDVSHSRVIFYKFDGENLDWEVAERTVERLRLALKEATNNELDSPVHILLAHVYRRNGSVLGLRETPTYALSEHALKYQKDLAQGWLKGQVQIETLLSDHMNNDFGLRALGYYCLESLDATQVAPRIAWQLAQAGQCDLATDIYAKLEAENKLNGDQLLKFAATYVDCCPDFEHVDTAISYVKRVLETYTKDSDEIIAFAHARRASLLQKKWELTEENAYLAEAIEAYGHALRHMQDERNRGRFRFPGMIAHTRLKLLTLRRKIGRDSKRQDLEGHRDAILKIVERSDDDPVSISYLHWSQAIALADLGETDQANGVVAKQLVQDAKLASQCIEVGGRQYLTLRQFLERYQDTWTNMGVISRQLRVSLR